MKQIKVSETTRLQLDWLASKCVGDFAFYHDIEDGQRFLNLWTDSAFLHYSSNWANGGALIERERITLDLYESGEWLAQIWGDDITDSDFEECGPTPLIAAMRCYVSSRMGDEVEVPEELL